MQVPKSTKFRLAVLSVGGAAVIATGIGVATATGEPSSPPPAPAEKNAAGQSLGSGEKVQSDAELPDLIAAYASNGEMGYITKADYVGPELTRDQVLRLPKKVEVQASPDGRSAPVEVLQAPPRTVPVYAADGKTVIGEFTFGR